MVDPAPTLARRVTNADSASAPVFSADRHCDATPVSSHPLPGSDLPTFLAPGADEAK